MANTFDQQARERFTASLKFMATAEALLEDDLIYRSALADAVSAIKNMLQGYLLLRIANTPASGMTQQWQETAASNRMPDLIAACSEAGLDLRGLAVDIRRLNNERNNRAHDDPQRQIEAEQASHAIETARTLQRRIKAAVEGKAEARSLPAMATQAVHVARAAVSGQLARKGRPLRPVLPREQRPLAQRGHPPQPRRAVSLRLRARPRAARLLGLAGCPCREAGRRS